MLLGVFSPLQTAMAQEEEIEVTVRGDRAAGASADTFEATRLNSEVSEEATRDAAAPSTPDALRHNALVSVQQTTPGQGTVYVRGFSGRGVGHAVDGVRLNTAIFRAGNVPHLGLLDPYSIESYTVVPGAASVEYGSDALGGQIAAYTVLPGYSLGQDSYSMRAFQAVSSNPLGTVSHIDAAAMRATFAAHVGFTYVQAGAIEPGSGQRSPVPDSYRWLERDAGATYVPEFSEKQIGTEFEFYAGNATVRKRLGRGRDLIARAQISVRPALVRYDQITPRFKSEVPTRAEDGLSPLTRQMASLELVQRSFESWLEDARLLLAWQRVFDRAMARRFDEVCLIGGVPNEDEPETCTDTLRLEPETVRITEETASNAVTLRGVARTASSARLSAELGLELHVDFISSQARERDIFSGVSSDVAARYADGSLLGEAGLFSRARYAATPRLTVTGGARAGLLVLDVASRPEPNATPGYERTLGDYAAELGLGYQLGQGVAVLANGGRGFRSPNVEDLSALGSRRQGRYQIPNPDLRPEHSYSGDVGLRVSRGALLLQTAVFFARYEDAIVLGPTSVAGQTTTAEGDAYYHSVNAARVDYHGIESRFSLPVVSNFALFGRWLSMLGTQYGDERSELPQETPADRVPPHQAELGVRTSWSPRISTELFGSWRAPQQRLNDPINLDDNRIPEGGTPGYLTLHARASYVASRSVKCRLALDNLTDQLVLEHGSGFYRAGFSATASLELSTDL